MVTGLSTESSPFQQEFFSLLTQIDSHLVKHRSLKPVFEQVASKVSTISSDTFGRRVEKEEIDSGLFSVRASTASVRPTRYRLAVPPQYSNTGKVTVTGIAIALSDTETALENRLFSSEVETQEVPKPRNPFAQIFVR